MLVRHGPVVDPLEVVLGFLQWAIALIDIECVAEVEPSISVDIERWHATGLGSAEVQSGYPGVSGWGRPNAIGIHTDAVAVKAEAEVRHDGRTDGVGSS